MTHTPKLPRKRTKTSRIRDGEAPRIRVRSKPLEQVDETKLALAFYLIAMQLVEDRTVAATEPQDETQSSAPASGEGGSAGVAGDAA